MAEMTLIVTSLAFLFLSSENRTNVGYCSPKKQSKSSFLHIGFRWLRPKKFHHPFFSTRTVQQGPVGRGVLYRHLLQHLGADRQRGQSLPSHGGADAAAELAQLGAFGVAKVSADAEGFHGGATARNLTPLAELSFVVDQRRFLGGGNSNIFGSFTPKIGEDEPILTSIFFKWVGNHQLGSVYCYDGDMARNSPVWSGRFLNERRLFFGVGWERVLVIKTDEF